MLTVPSDVLPSDRAKLSAGQWLVLIASFLGWLFDGYEQGLFGVIARPALHDVLGGAGDARIGPWMGHITACFLIGAAAGGIAFGWLGDRIGRVRAMALSILTYSLVTGAGYFVQNAWQLGAVRLISALGMGGQWSLGVALVMESWPERWRPMLAGLMGAAANVGFLLVGFVGRVHPVTVQSWRWMLLVGAAPALLVVFMLAYTPESARWRAAAKTPSGAPLVEIFRPALRARTLLGIAFASVALIGTWAAVQWMPLLADQLVGGKDPAAKANTTMLIAIGATIGSFCAPFVGARFGRRPAYFLLCLASAVLCQVFFWKIAGYGTTFLLGSLGIGLVTASFYGWFPLYLPELFPTRVRATAQGTCYNSGRILAAVGNEYAGDLVRQFNGSYAHAAAMVTLVYFVGMVLVWFAPETKGKPLPE
ncbi:MAG TPA: MFS transporter [Tepidisphaeraceae bacterium]|jgi:MFS family permease